MQPTALSALSSRARYAKGAHPCMAGLGFDVGRSHGHTAKFPMRDGCLDVNFQRLLQTLRTKYMQLKSSNARSW